DIVSKNGKDLRAFGEIVPADAFERVGLRVMRFVIVCGILHAPKGRDAFVVKGNVVGAAHFAKSGFREADFAIARERVKDIGESFARLIISHETDGECFSRSGIMNKDGGDFSEFAFVLFDVFARAVESLFFSGKEYEPNRALWFYAG